jgi:hypothetical protein
LSGNNTTLPNGEVDIARRAFGSTPTNYIINNGTILCDGVSGSSASVICELPIRNATSASKVELTGGDLTLTKAVPGSTNGTRDYSLYNVSGNVLIGVERTLKCEKGLRQDGGTLQTTDTFGTLDCSDSKTDLYGGSIDLNGMGRSSFGEFYLKGPLNFLGGSLNVDVDGAPSQDWLVVEGNIDLGAGTLNVRTSGMFDMTRLDIIVAFGTIVNDFANVTFTDFNGNPVVGWTTSKRQGTGLAQGIWYYSITSP